MAALRSVDPGSSSKVSSIAGQHQQSSLSPNTFASEDDYVQCCNGKVRCPGPGSDCGCRHGNEKVIIMPGYPWKSPFQAYQLAVYIQALQSDPPWLVQGNS